MKLFSRGKIAFTKNEKGVLIFLLLLACVYLWGIQRNLPYTPEVDEPIFVIRAIKIAATGDWNPHWFGNPGSTIIYPLAIIFKVWFAIIHKGSLFSPDPRLQIYFSSHFQEFYYLGRLLSVAYLMISLPLLYLIGKNVFNKKVGIIGSIFFLLSPIVVSNVQKVRTDGAGVFFCVLSIWFGVLLQKRPERKNYILTGAAIGLAIATRYFLVALIPFLLTCYLFIYYTLPTKAQRIAHLKNSIIGLGSVAFAFALSTPYFFLDFVTVRQNLISEARSTQLGQDGLSFWQNFLWYLTQAISANGKWPQSLLALFAIGLIFKKQHTKAISLVLFFVIFLVGISLSPLHWARWIIQVLPVWGLFAAFGLVSLLNFFNKKGRFSTKHQSIITGVIVLIIISWPLYDFVLANYRHANPTTRVLARIWIEENLPENSRLVQNKFTVPFSNTAYDVTEKNRIASSDYFVEDYVKEGQDYLIVKDWQYEAYFSESEKYAHEISFYQNLFTNHQLIYEIKPSILRGGPTIRIYQLSG